MTEQLSRAQQESKLNKALDKRVKELKNDRAKFKNEKKKLKNLKPELETEEQQELYNQAKKGVKSLWKAVMIYRIKLIRLRIKVNFFYFSMIDIFLTFGIVKFGLGLNSLLGLDAKMFIIANKIGIEQIFTGSYFILLALGYSMGRRNVLTISDVVKWIAYLVISEVALFGWDVYPKALIVWIFILISIVTNIVILTTKSLYRLFKSAVSDPKDRLTIIVAIIGAVIALIALFK